MYKDFRSYLDYLETKGKLCRVKKEVGVRYEIAAGIRKVSDTDGPALLFENIKGYPGWTVAGGIYATQKLIALAIGAEDDEAKITQRYLEFDQKRIRPKLCEVQTEGGAVMGIGSALYEMMQIDKGFAHNS